MCSTGRAADKKETASVSQRLSPAGDRRREGFEGDVFACQLLARSPECAHQSDHALDIRDFRGREDMDPVRSGRELGTCPGGGPVDRQKHDPLLSYLWWIDGVQAGPAGADARYRQ
jgi:hypothetical protein